MIPTWLKVSTTPFHSNKGGYGTVQTVLSKTSVSKDSPEFFHIKEVDCPAKVEKNSWEYITKKPKAQKKNSRYESSEGAPTWFQLVRKRILTI